MQVREIMTPNPESITRKTTLREAARKMRERRTGALPVEENGRPAGINTDRDIVVRAIAEGTDPDSARVEDVMTEDIVYCYDDERIDSLIKKMKDSQVRRLLIQNRDEHIAGIVSLGDVALATEDRGPSGEVLQEVSR